MSSDLAISAQGVSKSFPVYNKPHHRLFQMFSEDNSRWYKEFHALRNINIEIGRGETVGIVGRNGSGKSTLLQIICGTLSPTEGSVAVNGRIAALLELGAGFNPEFTGHENIYLNATILGLSEEEIDAKYDSIVEFADIGEFVQQPVKTYSSGMYVRLAFAVAIHVDPEILVVDEALSVGDEAFQRKCFARIDAIRDSGATVLFVSHSASTVVDLCDRAILLDHGELLMQGAPRDVITQYQKLLYAPADKAGAIRESIRHFDDHAPIEEGLLEIGSAQDNEDSGVSPESAAYFEEGMVSSSLVRYERRGALIMDPHIETLTGRRVNVIVPNEEYVYTYRVVAEQSLVGARFGMMIRSLTGVEIGGAATSVPEASVPIIEKGQEITIVFRFRCLLHPGVYFLNAGVLSKFEEGEDYADRMIDAVMIRVLPDNGRLSTGFVNLDFQPEIKV